MIDQNKFRNHEFFSEASESLLSELAEKSYWLHLRAKQIIVSHTEPSTNVFVIISGSLIVEIFSERGKVTFFREAHAGEIVGELAAIDNMPRSASVVAKSDCVVASIPGPDFRKALLSCPILMEKMLLILTRNIREMTNQIFELTALDVQSRVAAALCRLVPPVDQKEKKICINPAPTHETIANIVGTNREAVTRTLNALENDNIISKKRRQIIIHDFQKISHMANG